jgi:hypothetical protein
MPLLNSPVVRATGPVNEQDSAPMNGIIRLKREHTDEIAPMLVPSCCQRFPYAANDNSVFPFNSTRWVSANSFNGPKQGRPEIGQVSLNIPIGQGGINQNLSYLG